VSGAGYRSRTGAVRDAARAHLRQLRAERAARRSAAPLSPAAATKASDAISRTEPSGAGLTVSRETADALAGSLPSGPAADATLPTADLPAEFATPPIEKPAPQGAPLAPAAASDDATPADAHPGQSGPTVQAPDLDSPPSHSYPAGRTTAPLTEDFFGAGEQGAGSAAARPASTGPDETRETEPSQSPLVDPQPVEGDGPPARRRARTSRAAVRRQRAAADAVPPASAPQPPDPQEPDPAAHDTQAAAGFEASDNNDSKEATEAAPSDLSRLAGAGAGLVWMLQQSGVHSLAELAEADAETLSDKLGLVGQLLDMPAWIAQARTLHDEAIEEE